ncbi:hypothetical protein BH20ACT14_BH20ACT14_01690 [soil metagenome]
MASKGVARECPSCGSTERSVPSHPVALIETRPDGYVQIQAVSEDARAVVATFCGVVICDNCGHVRLHALPALGIEFP